MAAGTWFLELHSLQHFLSTRSADTALFILDDCTPFRL